MFNQMFEVTTIIFDTYEKVMNVHWSWDKEEFLNT